MGKKYRFKNYLFLLVVYVSLFEKAASQSAFKEEGTPIKIVPEQITSWQKQGMDCFNDPGSQNCGIGYKEKYIFRDLFDTPWSESEGNVKSICTDKDGLIYLLFGSPNSQIEIRQPTGKILSSFKCKVDSSQLYVVRTDENKNILVLGGGTAQIFNPQGQLKIEFKVKGIDNFSIERNIYRVWFSNGVVYSLFDGKIIHLMNDAQSVNVADLKCSLGDFEHKAVGRKNKDYGLITFKKTKKLRFPKQINHADFANLVFVDDQGNFYVEYEETFSLGTQAESNKPYTKSIDGIYKFDANLNLLAGFLFEPDFIDPVSQKVYSVVMDRLNKLDRVIEWQRSK